MIKATDIRTAMMKKWVEPEWAILWEVSNGTGAQGGRRFADAIMMSLWPSRGLELHGVEIKVTKSDWKREAKDPTKAELIAQYCDRWWVHTPPGIVPVEELPPAWGLREWSGKQWKTVKEADKTEAVPITRSFLAAMLRRADGVHKEQGRAMYELERQQLHNQHADMVKRVRAEVSRNHESLKASVDAFEQASGLKITGTWGASFEAKRIGAMVSVLSKMNPEHVVNGLKSTLRQIDQMKDPLQSVIDGLENLTEGNDR